MLVFILVVETGLVVRAEIGAIRVYQRFGSPVAAKVVRCRYDQSCSHYSLDVLQRDGFWLGNALIAKRLVMCSPIGWAIDSIFE